ncbi:MAG: hypothetical protein ACFCUS_14185 [Rubrimonas sp.]
MAKKLKPFLTPRFLRCIDIDLIGRLLDRHVAALAGFDPAVLDGPEETARAALDALLMAPAAALSAGLASDLHRIAALADAAGLRIIREQAARLGVEIAPGPDARRQDSRHIALLTFLDQPAVFDAASDMLTLQKFASLAEFIGRDAGVVASLTEETRSAFAQLAARACEADDRGSYCRLGWYGDGAALRIVVTHGSLVRTTPIVDGETERVISYRKAQHVVIAYAATTGRLEIGGAPKAFWPRIAEGFAATLLGRPGFFAFEDAQNLYTLAAIERAGGGFAFRHGFDPGIRRVCIVEARADRVIGVAATGRSLRADAYVARAVSGSAVARLEELMGERRLGASWRLRHVVIRVDFDVPGARPARVTVKLRPPATAAFRRDRFENRIMTLLHRNGLIHDRYADRAAVAAE